MSPERSGPIAGIVLAAGTATRMGVNKLLLEIDGESMLRHVVSRAVCSGLDPVFVVLGFEADRLEPELAGLRCTVLVNAEYERGMHTSFLQGVGQVPPDAVAALVMLADMPFVTAAMIRQLVSSYRASTASLVLSRYGDVTAPPTVFDRSLFGEFDRSEREGCGKRVVTRHRDSAELVDWPAQAITDLDVPLDYERVKTLLAAGR